MINILLNHPNFDEAWGYSEMEPYIHKEDEVLVLAFYDDSGYSSDMEVFEDSFSKGQKMYEEIVRPFRMFGLKDAQIHVVNYFDASKQEVLHQIEKADIIYIVGRFADWIMQRLEDLDIKNAIAGFDGVMIGVIAGGQVMLDQYEAYDEKREGLHRLEGFNLSLDYAQDTEHLSRILDSLEVEEKPVVCMKDKGGMIVDEGYFTLLGDAFVITENELEDVYAAYEDAKNENYW